MISRLFQFFETLVDPYTAYPDTDTPPRRLFAFLWDYSQPFKTLFAATAIMSLVVAAIEIGLIWYMGRVVDLLSTGAPSEVLADHGVELILVALFVLLIRPLMQGLDVTLLNNAILPQFGTLIRWRAHRQVLRQSVGWFEKRFRGPHRQPDHADPAERRRGGVPDLRRAHLRARLPRWCGDPALWGGSAPASSASGVVRALRAVAALDDRADRSRLAGQRRCALGHDGADRRHLHEHPCSEAFRPSRPGDRIREGGDREHAPDLRPRDAAFHHHGYRPDRPERPSDRGRGGLGHLALGRGVLRVLARWPPRRR